MYPVDHRVISDHKLVAHHIFVKRINRQALLRSGWWHNSNPFRGLSWQVGVLAILGTVLVAVGATALVSLFPVSDKAKCGILFGLGVVSCTIGYFLLKRAPATAQQKNPAAIKPTDHCHDSCNGFSEINRNFSHIPTIPNAAIAISSAPSRKPPIPNNVLAILASFHHYLIRVLHYVL